MKPDAQEGLRSPHVWVTSTYFAEGFPYTVVFNLVDFIFKSMGAGLAALGLTSLLHLPWNFKFLWGPFLDQYSTKRRWLLGTEIALCVVFVLASLATSIGGYIVTVTAAFALMAIVAATHDIAIDGYYLAALDEDGQSKFVGYRATAYKISSLVVTGPIVAVGGWFGWAAAMWAATGCMALITALHLRALPRAEVPGRPIRELLSEVWSRKLFVVAASIGALVVVERSFHPLGAARAWASDAMWLAAPSLAKLSVAHWVGLVLLGVLLGTLAMLGPILRRMQRSDSEYGRAFVSFLEQPKVGRILAFVVLFRLGEAALTKMKMPFLIDYVHMSEAEFATANGTVGVIFAFTGTFLGGWLIARHGLKRWIWPFVLSQNLLNLLFAALAAHPNRGFAWFVICFESLGSGLGTAVYVVFLMRCCHPDHKAAHFALLTALMSLSVTFAGVGSGFAAEALGFGAYFTVTFVATIPAMLLIFVLPHLDR